MQWYGKEGIDPVAHADYLKNFCDHFYNNCVRLIDDDMVRNRKFSDDPLYSECLQVRGSCGK